MKTWSRILPVLFSTLVFLLCQKNPLESKAIKPYAWKQARPEEQGMDSKVIGEALQQAGRKGFVNSLLIVRNGTLVVEKYFNGFDRDSPHIIRSVTKSVTSALIGLALQKNHLRNLDQKIMDFFQEYAADVRDRRMFDITIRHLLTMKAGLDSDSNLYFAVTTSPNWVKATLQSTLKYDPGERFCYSTPATHLLSAIITKVTGLSTLDFGDKTLFDPSTIFVKEWIQDPQGYYHGGSDMFLTARDMARFGYLYLQNGRLNERQIVPAEWISESLKYSHRAVNQTWGDLKNYGYGYLWWLGQLDKYEIVMALGHGGQFIINIPALQMIIVTTCNSFMLDWDRADQQERDVLALVVHHILPAVRD